METQEYNVILVGIDGSSQARHAFEEAVDVSLRNHAKLIIAYVIESKIYSIMGFSGMNEDVMNDAIARADDELKHYTEKAKQSGIKDIQIDMSFGSPKTIMANDLPRKYGADLIMVGQSGLNSVERFMVGSVSSYVIRHAPCDVLVVRPEDK